MALLIFCSGRTVHTRFLHRNGKKESRKYSHCSPVNLATAQVTSVELSPESLQLLSNAFPGDRFDGSSGSKILSSSPNHRLSGIGRDFKRSPRPHSLFGQPVPVFCSRSEICGTGLHFPATFLRHLCIIWAKSSSMSRWTRTWALPQTCKCLLPSSLLS